ncbi:hypothetical protein GJU40_02050 [Bacillus lacus]|uniref:Uncharacterized protein n=1 Tax=Metabacillus lacus TaxID=1983721 RepID=A0A7X2IWG5_9BACI|nr:hypothetical protein [Metabacillus lacus]MRX70949.1 hypothetical protein [Metabacillus lacus]
MKKTGHSSTNTSRIYAEPTNSPSLVIKTNLDPQDELDQNPYASSEAEQNKLQDYFGENNHE